MGGKMWELVRQVGSIRNFEFKIDNKTRIKLRFSSYKDDTFKIRIVSYISNEEIVRVLKVKSGSLEDVQKSAEKVFAVIRKKEEKIVAKIKKAELDYQNFFNNLKLEGKNES